MPDPLDSQESAALCDFLDLWLDDRAAGRRRSLAEYLRRFPGHEERVAREFLALDAREPAPSGAVSPEPPGERLGPYRLMEQLGRGGQGTVFLAEDVRLKRRVAVKILEGGLGGLPATRLARLKREAEALSRLDHPMLCAIYDVDLAAERPWFAMRYVPGETLALRIERARSGEPRVEGLLGRRPETRPEIDAVVRFVEQAARAVHVAHEAGIIHRDLKPGNVMIDAQSEPVVLDFGLARDVAADGCSITVSGDAFGTLAYMSPEQLSGEGELDRRTDVYSLAVTLYESLTLRRPVEAATRESLLKGILSGVREDAAQVNRALPRDLAIVLACALDVDRNRRYATALAFAEDLRRVREREPILARPAGWWILTRRWAERHPAAFAGGLAAFLLLTTGLVVTLMLLARVTREQDQTRREQSKLIALRQAYLAQIVANEKPALALRLGIEAARREHHPEIDNILYDLLDRCYEKTTFAIGERSSWVAIGSEPLLDAEDRLISGYAGGIAAFDLATSARTDLVANLATEQGLNGPPHLAWTADRRLLASIHESGTVRLIDLGPTPRVREVRETGQTAPTWIEFFHDARRFATASRDGSVVIHEVDAPESRVAFALPERSLTGARWNPSGALVAVCGLVRAPQPDGVQSAAVFDSKSGREVVRLGPPGVSAIWEAWSADGSRLAVAFDATVKVFRASDWTEEASLVHGDRVYWAAFDPKDEKLITGSPDGVSVWDPRAGVRLATAGDFRERSVIRGAFSPDGTKLAVIAWDQTASVFSCETWREERKLKGLGRPRGVCWSRDGSLFVTSDEATGLHLWHPADRPHLPVLRGHGDRVMTAAFRADGKAVLTASADGNARLFDSTTGRLLQAMNHGKPLAAARLLPSGGVLTIGGGKLSTWDGRSGAHLRDLVVDLDSNPSLRSGSGTPGKGVAAADAWPLSRDRVFATYADGTARVWDAAGGVVLHVFSGHRGPIVSAALHEGRGWAATGGSDRSVLIWDLESGRSVAVLDYAKPLPPSAGPHLARAFAIAFDRDGTRVVAGCEDVSFRIWSLPDGRLVREEAFPTPGMLALSPEGRWMMVGAKWLGRVAFLEIGKPEAPLRAAPFHDSHMNAAIRFSPNGELALAASKDGTVRLWSMDTMRAHSVFDARCGILLDADFSPDGRRVVLAGTDGTARIWPIDPLAIAERVCPVSDEVWEAMQGTLEQALFVR